MKKIYNLEDLDCANCAMKMQDAICKLDGINEVGVDFLTQKMYIDAADENFDKIMKEVAKCVKKVEPDCTILSL